jgi:hypothetical protein
MVCHSNLSGLSSIEQYRQVPFPAQKSTGTNDSSTELKRTAGSAYAAFPMINGILHLGNKLNATMCVARAGMDQIPIIVQQTQQTKATAQEELETKVAP